MLQINKNSEFKNLQAWQIIADRYIVSLLSKTNWESADWVYLSGRKLVIV